VTLVVKRIAAPFGAELLGADLHSPPPPELIGTVDRAVAEHAVVVIRDKRLRR
jgi:alpha-ketoglutarate-dependent taurine dioxygenase